MWVMTSRCGCIPRNVWVIMIIIKTLVPVKLNSFTHLRALLVLHDRGILAHATSITGHDVRVTSCCIIVGVCIH
jgi:uncharacterized membrane protein